MEGNSFTAISNKPPLNAPILLKLHDVWRGKGEEDEEVEAIYNGKTYVSPVNGGRIHEMIIVGWRPIP
ncbi:MAG: hypothetical protein C4576_19745 [Desulfobacteraceae bacterium]|nr:MAG: hypothetical protein C4576_19745 [Desulfobacteraceae bacterium]